MTLQINAADIHVVLDGFQVVIILAVALLIGYIIGFLDAWRHRGGY